MKKLVALLTSALLIFINPVQIWASNDTVEPSRIGIVLFSNTCDDQILTTLMDYSTITYLDMYKYYLPSVPQIFCFTLNTDAKYIADALDFIIKYNEIVILMFEDDQYSDGYATGIAHIYDIPFTENDAQEAYGVAFYDKNVIIMQYQNVGKNVPKGWDNGDFTSLTLTHELAHLILKSYGYDISVYRDWVHKTQDLINTGKYDTGFKLYSYISNRWYQVFEKYPVENDFK